MDKWLEYEGFSRVAALQSFTAAAASLGITASAVSKQVRSLEERLGVRLLHRTTRRVSLTAEGRGFYQRLRGVLEDVADAEQELGNAQAELRGSLRIGAPMDFGRLHLAAPLAEFAASHPGIELEVEFTDRFVDLVEDGLDVGVRIGKLADSSLVARRLAPCRRVLCASPAYLAEQGEPCVPSDLRRCHKIAYTYDNDQSWSFQSANDQGGEVRVSVPIRHRANNGHMLCALLRAGQGIALVPTFLASDDLRTGRLKSVLDGSLRADISIHAVYPHRRQLSSKVRRLVDFLAQHCGARPYWDDELVLGAAD